MQLVIRIRGKRAKASSFSRDCAKPELMDCNIGKLLDLQTYAAGIGSRAGGKGNKVQVWSRMLALFHLKDGRIIGRASFDDMPDSEETSVECLVVSYNPSASPPFEETVSISVLIFRKKELEYIRLGVARYSYDLGRGWRACLTVES